MAVSEEPLVRLTTINRTPTHVVEATSFCTPQRAPNVVVVPGSPGMGHLYVPFVRKLHELCNRRVNLSVVSHAGHSPGNFRERDSCSRRWYNLQDQISHKMAYLQSQFQPESPLILIGHSIGCHMILQMLKDIDPGRIQKVILLFPTIERMHESSSGRRLAPFFSWLIPLLLFLTFLCFLVPRFVTRIYLRMRFMYCPPKHQAYMIEGAMNIVNVKSVYNILTMANEELDVVRELDASTIVKFGSKMHVYYGVRDHWVPDDTCCNFRDKFPHVHVEQCEHNHEHAFILKNSDDMAEHVYSYLQGCI